MKSQICIIDNCHSPMYAKQRCTKHYTQLKRSEIDYGKCTDCDAGLKTKSKSGRCRPCNAKHVASLRNKNTAHCKDCGKELKRLDNKRCRACNTEYMKINPPNPYGLGKGADHPSWKGGTYMTKRGYRMVKSPEGHSSDSSGYIQEHRLVIEKSLGRQLMPHEVVHHKDGDKLNNQLDNLEVMSQAEHIKLHAPHEEQEIERDPYTGRFI